MTFTRPLPREPLIPVRQCIGQSNLPHVWDAIEIVSCNPVRAEDAEPADVGYIQEGLFRDIATSKFGD